MSIKRILCIILSLLFIFGSISIIYANNDNEQTIDNNETNNQKNEIQIIDSFEILYDEETHEQIPLFNFIISSETNIDDLNFPKTLKGYIKNELVDDIKVIEWKINSKYEDKITDEYITYIPIFNTDEYQLSNNIILPVGIIKFTDLAPMEKFNMLKDCDNCGLNGIFENIGSTENLNIDNILNEDEDEDEEISIQSTDNLNPVKSSNYTTLTANVGLPSSYYSTSIKGTVKGHDGIGYSQDHSTYYWRELVWLPPNYETMKEQGTKFNVVFLLNGGAGTITYNDDGTVILSDGSTNDWIYRSIENMSGRKLFTNLIKDGTVPKNTIFAAIHCTVDDSATTLLNRMKVILQNYPTYATYSDNNSTLLNNMKEYGCTYALVSLSASTWTTTKFMSKYNGVINNYLMMSYGRKTASELVDSISDRYGKTKNLIVAAGTNEEADWNNSSIKSIQFLADHAENAYYISFNNGNHNWALWYSSVYFIFDRDLDCMGEETGKAYILKHSNIPELESSYPLTGIKFTIYTNEACTEIAKDKDGNNAILTVKKVDNEYKTDTIELKTGNYWVKETDSISNYILNTEVKPVTIEKDKTKKIEYTNTLKTGKLFIKKTTDGSIFDPIDCEFKVYTDEACTQIAKMICIDNNNNITIKNAKLTIIEKATDGDYWLSDTIILPIGTYYVKETKAIEPFEICSDINEISIKNNKTTTTSFDNIPKQAKATIIKTVTQYDLIDKFPIVGTTFTIYSEYIDETHYTIAKDIYTNEDAILVVKKIGNEYKTNTVTLLPGTYWIEETVTMPYYETIEGQSITLSKNEDKVLEFENELQVGLGKVQKIW